MVRWEKALTPAIKAAAAGLGVAVFGPMVGGLGVWVVGALGATATGLVVKYADAFGEKAAEKFLDSGADYLLEHLKGPARTLEDAYRLALRSGLRRVHSDLGAVCPDWFGNWEACLSDREFLSLTPIGTGQPFPTGVDRHLRTTLELLDAIGANKRNKATISCRAVPEELIAGLEQHLPDYFASEFQSLIYTEEYSAAWRQLESILARQLVAIVQSSHDQVLNQIKIGFDKQQLANQALESLLRERMRLGPGHEEPDVRPSPLTYSLEEQAAVLQGYLEWLISSLRNLEEGVEIHNERVEIPLEDVYVALRGYPGAITEIQQSEKLDEESAHDGLQEPTVWQERNRKLEFASQSLKTLDLAQAYRDFSSLIILGDPGSGKTTLLRWLTLTSARAMLHGEKESRVPALSVDPDASSSESLVSLGPVKLPIYLRVGEFHKLWSKKKGTLSLVDALAYGEEFGRPLYPTSHAKGRTRIETELISSLILDFIRRDQGVVFLDGLDEIANPDDRKSIVRQIHKFIDDFIPAQSSPVAESGNKLVVTSRRVGYKSNALREQVTPFTVEELSETSIRRFSAAWHHACRKALTTLPNENPKQATSSASDAFLKQIFDPQRQTLRELASNPLMLNLLCATNLENNHELPQTRAGLYEVLVERGFKRAWTDQDGRNGELKSRLSDILIGVAIKIHETSSTGLVSRVELEENIGRLAKLHGSDAEVSEARTDLCHSIITRSGLIAERGLGKFGFRHLTIQEYLVGKGLVRDPELAPSLLLARATDPRSHEALLLGLGYLSECSSLDTFESVCTRLLNRSSSPGEDVWPTGAIIIAEALREVRYFSPAIVGLALRQLLESYADYSESSHSANLAEFVEATFSLVIRSPSIPQQWSAEAEGQLIEALRSGPIRMVNAAAQIILKCDLFLTSLAEPLLNVLRFDNEETDFVINRTLSTMASFKDNLPKAHQPFSDRFVAQLDPKMVEVLRNRNVVISVRQRGQKTSAERRLDMGLPAHLLPMRIALESSEELTAGIRNNLQSMQLIVGLYGGLGNFGAIDLRRNLGASRVQIGSLVVQENMRELAVYMDTVLQPKWERISKRSLTFQASYIYRDSPLTPLLLRTLGESSSFDELIGTLIRIWQDPACDEAEELISVYRFSTSQNTDEAASGLIDLLSDTLVALALLRQDISEYLHSEYAQSTKASAALAAQREIQRIRKSLDENLVLCETPAKDILKALSAALDELRDPVPTPEVLFREEASVLESDVAEVFPDDTYKRAESVARAFRSLISNGSPDATYKAAVFLDSRGKAITSDLHALVVAWAIIDMRHREIWSNLRSHYLAHAMAESNLSPELFVHALSAIDSIPRRFDFVKAWLLRRLAPAMRDEIASLGTVALAVAWSLRHDRVLLSDALTGLRPELIGRPLEEYRSEVMQSITSLAPDDGLARFWTMRFLEPLPSDSAWVSQMHDLAEAISEESVRSLALLEVDSLRASGNGVESPAIARKHLWDNASQTLPASGPSVSDVIALPESRPEVKLFEVIAAVSELTEKSGANPVDTTDLITTQTHSSALTEYLEQYWRKIFLSDTEDRVYSLAVVLDTIGKRLSLDGRALAISLGRCLPLARQLHWDRLGRTLPVETASSVTEQVLLALVFLSLLPNDYAFFVGWSIRRLSPLIHQTVPDLKPLAASIALDLDDPSREQALSDFGHNLVRMPQSEAYRWVQESTDGILDPFLRVHTMWRIRGSYGNVFSTSALADLVLEIRDDYQRQQVLEMIIIDQPRDFVSSCGPERAIELIGSVNDPVRRTALLQLLLLSGLNADELSILSNYIRAQGWIISGELNFANLILGSEPRSRELSASKKADVCRWLESHSPENEATMPALCAITLALRSEALLGNWRTLHPAPHLWGTFAREPGNEKLSRQMLNLAAEGRLTLTSTAVSAIQTLWNAGEVGRSILGGLLPLIRASDTAVNSTLQSWASPSEDHLLSQWAALMLAERGLVSKTTFKRCVSLLYGDSDLLRHRATLAIIRNELGASQHFRALTLGTETLEQMARDALRFNSSIPGITLKIVWSFERIIFDERSHIVRWVEILKSNGKGSSEAEYLLGIIHYAVPGVGNQLLDQLELDLPSRVKIAILNSFIHFCHTRWSKASSSRAISVRLRSILPVLLQSQDKNLAAKAAIVLGYAASSVDEGEFLVRIATQRPEVRDAALHGLALLVERHPMEAQVIADKLVPFFIDPTSRDAADAGEVLLRGGEEIELIRLRVVHEQTLISAIISSVDGYYEDSSYRKWLGRGAEFIRAATSEYLENNPNGYGHALASIIERLETALLNISETNERKIHPSRRLGNIIVICAAAAEMLPDTYLRVVRYRFPNLQHLLKDAACIQKSFTGRRAALTLLSLLKQFNAYSSKAITSALSDVIPVQKTAVETASRFLEIDPKQWSDLETLLSSKSECTAWTATRIILKIVENVNLAPGVREDLRKKARHILVNRLRSAGPRRLVCVLDGEGDAVQIRIIGWLDSILREALHSLGAGNLVGRRKVQEVPDSHVEVRLRNQRSDGNSDLTVIIPADSSSDPINHQRFWAEKQSTGSISHEVTGMMSNISEVARRNGIAFTDLIQSVYQA